jgi:hypothetical protein
MKLNVIRVTALTIVAAFGLAAHAQLTAVKASKTLVSASPNVTRSLSGSFTMLQAVPAKALLVGYVSSKHTTVGTVITARLTQSVFLQKGSALPKGTLLLGKVISVTPATKGTDGTVTFTFDQAKLHDGTLVPVKAMIVDVADAQDSEFIDASLDNTEPLPSYPTVNRIPADKGLIGLESALNSQNSGKVVCNGKNLELAEGAQFKFALLAAPKAR